MKPVEEREGSRAARFKPSDVAVVLVSAAIADIIYACSRILNHIYGSMLSALGSPEMEAFIPVVTRVALEHVAVFVVAILLVGIWELVASRRGQSGSYATLITGSSIQGLVVWLAFFCFFFESFKGVGCLHNTSSFDFAEFVASAYGVFPIALMALLATLVLGIRGMHGAQSPRHGGG